MSMISGVAVGIVTSNNDPEKCGRLKIKLPLFPDNEVWARMATFMSSRARGSFFLPEIGDEVLIAFENGDINHPYVIGSLWNAVDQPPETNSDGKNNIRKIKSRSGHEIIFNDNNTARKESLEIHTNSGHKIVLDDSIGNEKIEIIDKSQNNKVVIDSVQNSICIESMQFNIKANIIEIEGTSSLTLKSSAVLTIQGSLVKIN